MPKIHVWIVLAVIVQLSYQLSITHRNLYLTKNASALIPHIPFHPVIAPHHITPLTPPHYIYPTSRLISSHLIAVMSFLSAQTKKKAADTVNKLFESILPGNRVLPQEAPVSSAEQFHREASKQRLLPEEICRLNKIHKVKQNRRVNKKIVQNRKFNKLVKYTLIKKHKDSAHLGEEEQRFLRNLVKNNVAAVRRAGDIGGCVRDELDELRAEILHLESQKHDRTNSKMKENRLQAFKEKISSGTLSYPGLTPGLAPVGEDESESE